jgi:type II secretory pathway pseudopilin PulG
MNRRTTHACVAAASRQQPGSDLPGATLLEALVALAIVTIALTVFVSMLQFGVHSVAGLHEQTLATALARSQMEAVKAAAWPGPYPPVAAPSGYTVSVANAAGPVAGVQLITVRVHHGGQTVLTLEGYKGQR